MPAGIQGLRGTGEFNTDIRPKNYRQGYTLLEPNGTAPLNALLAMGKSESTDDPEYKNFRDELPTRVVKVSAQAAAQATTITLSTNDQNKFITKDTLLVNGGSGEVMRAMADVTGTELTVVRAIGKTVSATTAPILAVNTELWIIGTAHPENSTAPTPVTFDVTVANNYCQIFRNSFGLSNTLKNTHLRTGPKDVELRMKALKLHMTDIERGFFFGQKHEENGSSSTPTRYTGGIMSQLSQVVDLATDYTTYGGNAANNMPEEGFDELLIDKVFAFGSKEKIAFCGAGVIHQLQQIAKDRWEVDSVDGTYGVNLTRYKTFAGSVMVHLHPQFRQYEHLKHTMVLLDFPYLAFRHLRNRDTMLLKDRQAPSQDGTLEEYLTECGLELLQDKVHTVIKNWKGRASA